MRDLCRLIGWMVVDLIGRQISERIEVEFGKALSPAGGSDARTALDDAVRHGNNPYRCACPGSDVRSTLPCLHAGLQQRRQFHRVWLYINGSVCSDGVRPRSSVLRQPILCAYKQESVSQGLGTFTNSETLIRFFAQSTISTWSMRR